MYNTHGIAVMINIDYVFVIQPPTCHLLCSKIIHNNTTGRDSFRERIKGTVKNCVSNKCAGLRVSPVLRAYGRRVISKKIILLSWLSEKGDSPIDNAARGRGYRRCSIWVLDRDTLDLIIDHVNNCNLLWADAKHHVDARVR